MRIGVIGLGSIGERHVRNIQALFPGARIDILTSRRSWEGTSPRTVLYASSAAFFKEKHDVYFITNDTGKHAATILRCLKQSPKGVFVEKPLSHTSQDIRKLRRALTRYRGVFFVAYCLQYFAPLRVLKGVLESGAIGKAVMMRVSAGKDMRTWRTRDFKKSYSSNARRGGGVILDLIHEINYPAWLLGEKLSFVSGAWGRIMLPIGAEDIAESTYVSSKGTVVSIHQDYMQTPGMRSCEVFGEKGTAVWSRVLRRGSEENQIRIESSRKTVVKRVRAGGNDMYLAELRAFMHNVRTGRRSSNFEEAAQDLVNADALKRMGARISRK